MNEQVHSVGTYWTVTCEACDHSWNQAGAWSVYERQAVESRPCPCCGGYTLAVPEPKASRGRGRRPFHAPVPTGGRGRAA